MRTTRHDFHFADGRVEVHEVELPEGATVPPRFVEIYDPVHKEPPNSLEDVSPDHIAGYLRVFRRVDWGNAQGDRWSVYEEEVPCIRS